MADKLDWLGKHLILVRCLSVSEAVEKENYKIRPDLAELFTGMDSAEEMAFKLAKAEKYKDACELLAYIAHKRAGIWWGYRCLLSLLEELGINPAADVDITGIAAEFKVTVPDFARVEMPDPADTSELDAYIADTNAKIQEMRKYANPTVMKMVDDGIALAFAEFKKVHGLDPIELVQKLQQRIVGGSFHVDPNSPVFKARDELRAQLQTMRMQTIDTIKSVIPPKVPAHEKKVRDDALSAVYRWIVAPDEENSKSCLDIGNECPDTPAGLLSLSAFWAFGNLLPGGKQVIPTPPGLAANGLVQTLLMCALHKGGTRKVRERYEVYFNLGVDVLSGKDNWEESLAGGKAPHEEPLAMNNEQGADGKEQGGGNNGYKRWKPPAG